MTLSKTLAAVIVGATLVLGMSAAVQVAATKLPKKGEFSATITQQGSWEGFAIGHQHWVWIARREGVYSGSGLLNGMTSRCVSKGKTLFGVSEAGIHCENTDQDGDKIFEVSKEQCVCGPGQKGGTGKGEFIGGTGKYERIRGAFEIERKVGARNREARTWTDHVKVTGKWELP